LSLVAAPVPSPDRARRATIACSCCGLEGAHRGHGWCVACYTRWVYWGRPAEGPPLPGAAPRRARPRKPAAVPARCRSGRHALTDTNLIMQDTSWRCRACQSEVEARYRRRRFARRHDGHNVITTRAGLPYCRTCTRGDPPGRLSIAEREAAIVQLRAWGLTYQETGERVGCSLQTAFWTCKRLGTRNTAEARAWIEASALGIAA